MPDHIHQCLSIPPKYSVAHVIGLLKGKSASGVMSFGTKSSRMVRGRTFWARGYCVSTVGLDEEKVREYIRNQELADKLHDKAGKGHYLMRYVPGRISLMPLMPDANGVDLPFVNSPESTFNNNSNSLQVDGEPLPREGNSACTPVLNPLQEEAP